MLRRPPPIPIPRSSLLAAAAPAFDAHPSDVVLVKSYLRPWVAQGVRPPGAFVHAADLYAAEPEDLARRHRAAVARDGERAWYFLSPLRTKSPRGRRKSRTVEGGTGWWHGEAGPKPVLDPLDGRRKVGYRQSFSFMKRGDDGAPVRTGWIMLELRLHDDEDDGDGGGGLGDQLEGLVMCKVYRSPRHPDTAAAAADDGDDESCVAAAAPGGRHGNAADGEESPGAPRVAAVAPGGKRKADDYEGSSLGTPRRDRDTKNAHGETSGAAAAVMAPGTKKQAADGENEVSGAATSPAPGTKEKAAADDGNEISGATTATMRGNEEGKRAADGDEDSSASTPASKRARKAADDEGSGAAAASALVPEPAPALMRKPGVVALAPAPQQLLCPQCGFHIGLLQAAVAPAKPTSETGTRIAQTGAPQGGGRTGDASGKDPSTHRLLLRFSDPKQA